FRPGGALGLCPEGRSWTRDEEAAPGYDRPRAPVEPVAGGVALLPSRDPRVQPPELRLCTLLAIRGALRSRTQAGRPVGHEPRALGDGPDRGAVRRGGDGPGLAGDHRGLRQTRA